MWLDVEQERGQNTLGFERWETVRGVTMGNLRWETYVTVGAPRLTTARRQHCICPLGHMHPDRAPTDYGRSQALPSTPRAVLIYALSP